MGKHIITAALPYANGSIHIGHLLEYIQADIYSRFLKMMGEDALYICASDMHGTPIEVNAKKAGISPKEFTKKYQLEHQEDFASYNILFDNYYSTDSNENKEIVNHFYSELKKKGYIYTKKVEIVYCQSCQRSLPDRFVKGTCPLCTAVDQYGDVCESCGSVLKGIDLINPKCTQCGKPPVIKESKHYFFKLSAFSEKLKSWLKNANLQKEVRNWLDEWFEKGLDDWCVSRDAPYFGFEIPNSKEETGEIKYFYVWLDAPLGYISSTMNLKKDWEKYWKEGSVHHFIGKDIAYFHFLFWPAQLMALNYPIPNLNVHGFITVNGKKMSKSRGTFFTAKDFLKLYPAESLRFYYASHLSKNIVDIDLHFDDFIAVNNNVLVGNVGNFCYRTLSFANKNYNEIKEIANIPETKEVLKIVNQIKQDYKNLDFMSAVRKILLIADIGNAFFQKCEVWVDKDKKDLQVGWCINLARNLSILLEPILPNFSNKIKKALNETTLTFDDINFNWKGTVNKPDYLAQKIEKMPESAKFPLQLKVGQIIKVNDHPNADSLYLLKVDFGTEKRQIVAGLKKYFNKEALLNQKAVFCVNLKPAKLRGEISEGMIIVADDTENVALLKASKTDIGNEAKFEGLESNKEQVTFDEFKKLNMKVLNGNVVFDNNILKTNVEDIKVHGVKEGSHLF